MSNDPGAHGEQHHPGQQGWPQQPHQPQQPQPQPQYPGAFGQEPQPGWGAYPPPGGPPPGPGGYPTAAMGPGVASGGPQGQSSGFEALFDFGFTRFLTPAAVKVLYIVGLVLMGLGYLSYVIVSFAGAGAGFGLITLIVGAVVVLFYLIVFRIFLEACYAAVRMFEDSRQRR